MTSRRFKIYKDKTGARMMNVPKSWLGAIGKDEMPGILIEGEGKEPAIVFNVEPERLMDWSWSLARSAYTASIPPEPARHGALRRRFEKACAKLGIAPLQLDSLRVLGPGMARFALSSTAPPRDVEALRSISDELGVNHELVLGVPIPSVDFTAIDGVDNIFTRSAVEERRIEDAGKVKPSVPDAKASWDVIEAIVGTVVHELDAFNVALEAAAKRASITITSRGMVPLFHLGSSIGMPFAAFKTVNVGSIDPDAWIELERAFRMKSGSFDLDLVPCVTVEQCADGWRFDKTTIPRSELTTTTASGVIPLVPGMTMERIIEKVQAEMNRVVKLRLEGLYWVRGYPPPAFPDRMDDATPLVCPRCARDVTPDIYGSKTLNNAARCPGCKVNLYLEFSAGAYTIINTRKGD